MSIRADCAPAIVPDKVLYQDFYESFRFSQGVKPSQVFLYGVLGHLYRELNLAFPEDLAAPKYLGKAGALKVPANHGSLSLSVQQGEFKEQWQIFSQILSGSRATEDYEGVSPYDRIAHDLLANDLSYAEDATRKRFPNQSGSFQSYFREYVILKTQVSSARFNLITDRMHSRAEERAYYTEPTNYHGRVGKLVVAWEQRNQLGFSEGACEPIANLCEKATALITA